MNRFVLLIAAVAMILTTSLSSCKKDEEKKTFTVTFNADGGTPAPEAQTVTEGGKVTKPADPAKSENVFGGWFNGTTQWNFGTGTVNANLTLKAMWIRQYSVTFDAAGGTPVPTAQTVAEGGKVTKPTDPAKSGSVFGGWFNGSTQWNFEMGTVSAAMTLTAHWTVAHAVTFDVAGGTPAPKVQEVPEGARATEPAEPVRDGYAFDGWFRGEAEWNFATAITAPLTLTAKWTKVHTVTFNSNGSMAIPAQTVRDGAVAIRPEPNPVRDGYAFDGWYSGEAEWNFATAITAPLTLTAKWIAVYAVTFNSDGGTAVPAQNVRSGSTATRPNDPVKTMTIQSGLYLGTPAPDANYIFEGWYSGNVLWDFSSPVTGPVTLTARWSGVNVTRIETVLPNDVAGAFAYVNANTLSGEEYTLLIGTDVTVAQMQTLSSANAKLTVMGLGTERTITSTDVTLFTVNGNDVTSLIMGQNISITYNDDRVSSGREETKLTRVQRGSLTMRNGSKITGSPRGAVYIAGANAVFNMEGGEITGNTTNLARMNVVYVAAGGIFEMSGGRIAGNYTGYNGDYMDVFIMPTATFRLSGNARIGTLALHANSATALSSVIINGNYSGTVTVLHLVSDAYANTNTTALWWTNAHVIVGGTANNNSMFGNALGEFRNNNYSSYSPLTISATHVLNADGYLILKEE